MNVAIALLFAWAGFLPMVFMIWAMWCIHRTHESRMRMIYDAGKMPTPLYMAHMHAFDQVTYAAHMRALFFFRDPIKLYPKVGFVVMENPEFGQPERMN